MRVVPEKFLFEMERKYKSSLKTDYQQIIWNGGGNILQIYNILK